MATGTDAIATYGDLGTLASSYGDSSKCCTGNGINTFTLMTHEDSNQCVKYSDIELPYLQTIYTTTPTQNNARLKYFNKKYYLNYTFFQSSVGATVNYESDKVDIFGINSYSKQNFRGVQGSTYTTYVDNDYFEGYITYSAGQDGTNENAILNIMPGSSPLKLKNLPGYSGHFYMGNVPYVTVKFSYYNRLGTTCIASFPLYLMISYSYL